jgi:hypothetical protein
MPHHDIASQQDADPGQQPERPGPPSGKVRRERIPTFVDQLDCLLTVWMAEATLDGERDARGDRSDATEAAAAQALTPRHPSPRKALRRS